MKTQNLILIVLVRRENDNVNMQRFQDTRPCRLVNRVSGLCIR